MLLIQCHKGYLLCIWAEYFECQYDFLSKKIKDTWKTYIIFEYLRKEKQLFYIFHELFLFFTKKKNK